MEIRISGNGVKVRQTVLEFINGKMVIDTKESGNIVLNMVKEQICLLTVMFTQVNILKGNLMDLDSINGKIHPIMSENSSQV